MRTKGKWPLLAAAVVFAAACGGGGGSSPTESNRSPLSIDVTLRSPEGESTIVRCSLHLDGAPAGTFSSSTPTGFARMDTTISVGPGSHVLAAQIDEQTSGPTVYRLTGTVVFRGVPTPISETGTLATGSRIEAHFQL